MSFAELGLSSELINGLADISLEEPTPLQYKVVPATLEGKNLLVKNENADEGAFLIPVLQNILNHGEVKETRILILTPSKERAKKIDELVWAMGYHAQISSAAIAMGGTKDEQKLALEDGAPVIVANPGQLLSILYKSDFRFKNISSVIIDNGHEMDNYNLVSKVNSVFKFIDGKPQILVHSAELNKATKELSSNLFVDTVVVGFNADALENTSKSKNPAQVDDSKKTKNADDKNADEEVSNTSKKTQQQHPDNSKGNKGGQQLSPEKKLEKLPFNVILKKDLPEQKEEKEVKQSSSNKAQAAKKNAANTPPPLTGKLSQYYINVPPRMKISTLMVHLENTLNGRVIIFTASKRTANRLFRIILKKNWGVVSVYDGIEKEVFEERYNKFASGDMKILLVGSIPAKDLDIENVSQVINYDVPTETDEYRYRAELVKNGKATQLVSLVSKMDKQDMNSIVKEVGYPPTEISLPDEIKEKKRSKKGSKRNSSHKKADFKRGKKQSKHKKDFTKKSKKPKSKKELPRPNYDGLAGGRDGESKGVMGWLKKLFK